MQAEDRTTKQMNDQPSGNLPFLKPDDIQYFDKLLVSIPFVRTAAGHLSGPKLHRRADG